MLSRILYSASCISVVLLVLLILVTTPTEVGPLGVLAFFVLLYASLLGAVAGLLRCGSKFLSKITKNFVLSRPVVILSTKRCYYLSTIISIAPVLVIAIQSFGGIGFLELGLILLFEVIVCFLVIKR